MRETGKYTNNGDPHGDVEQWPGINSRYQLIIVAGLRSKQLVRGSLPRIEADPRKRRTTSIALEEVKRGLVPFTMGNADENGSTADTKNGDN
jgi:DNA-directed RNA polymerase omega subunit